MKEMGGELPSDIKPLRALPGIGRSTAGAIASIAFGKDEPVLDGNIRRVFSRVFNLIDPPRSPAGEKKLWELASAHLPSGKAGEYNQALMDLGATICTTRNPDCLHCPIAAGCEALALGLRQERPVVKAKATIPHYTVTAAVINRDHKVLIAQRPLDGLLGGMWEFPGGKQLPDEDLITCLQREIREELGARINVYEPLGVYRQAYTHFRVTLHAYCCTLLGNDSPKAIQVDDIRWVSLAELSKFPMGKIDRRIANELPINWVQKGNNDYCGRS
jgi:A/G-specific adenine glycosylase